MALTKVSRGLLSTGIVDNSNATAITLNADESATFAGAISVTGQTIISSNALVSTPSTYYDDIVVQNSASGTGAGMTVLVNATNGFGGVKFGDSTNSNQFGIGFDANANTGFLDVSGSQALTVTSNRKVGIGVSAPSALLNIAHESHGIALGFEGATLPVTAGMYTSSSTNFGQAYGSLVIQSRTDYAGYSTIFRGNGGEAMRVSGGNLLVGTTDTAPGAGDTNAGVSIRGGSDNRSFFSVNGDYVMHLNRNTNDGNILEFSKNGTGVGSIGSYSSDRLFIGAGDTNITFKPSHDIFYPSTSTGAARDNAIDLGDSGARFKDLYLSGTMIGNILKLRQQAGSMYVSSTNANTLNGSYDEDADAADMWINYRGYQDGFSRYRDLRVGNGKGGVIIFVDGSAASVAINGSLSVSSSFSKGSGSFKIDHPLPAKTETHHLVHSFIEGPQADNIYRGKIDLVDGSATVNIDTAAGMTEGTYVLLNTNTQCFTSNESGWTAVKGSLSGNILTITAQDNTCTETISWMVVGERHDQHMIDTEWTDGDGKVIVEPLKELEEETTTMENT